MVEPAAMFRVRAGIIVLALKSGITFMRTRPDARPRFSTAASTRAARRSLSCRLPRNPACSSPIHVSSTSISPRKGSRVYSPLRDGACAASSTRSPSGTDRVAAAGAGRKLPACRWSSNTPPRTNWSNGSWSDEGWSRMSTKHVAGTWRIVGDVGSPIHTPERAHIEDK
jgi:hypothetical protein